jgi:hypothetical protein
MKKISSVLLILTLVFSSLSLNSCAKNDGEELMLGVGVYTSLDTSDAGASSIGYGEIMHTVAATLCDKDGKIIKCLLDAADNKIEFTSDGKYVTPGEFKTKRELGDLYVMSSDENKLKWYEQADAFAKLAIGKSTDEINALVAEGGRGNASVISAGCTIVVSEFAKAIERSVKNAKSQTLSRNVTLGLGVVTVAEGTDARDAASGKIDVETTVSASALINDTIASVISDSCELSVSFDKSGKVLSGNKNEYNTKRELGDKYGMATLGKDNNADGKVLEWYMQADAFDMLCVGKTGSEVAALNAGGYGTAEVQKSGCTIKVFSLIRAVQKSAAKT